MTCKDQNVVRDLCRVKQCARSDSQRRLRAGVPPRVEPLWRYRRVSALTFRSHHACIWTCRSATETRPQKRRRTAGLGCEARPATRSLARFHLATRLDDDLLVAEDLAVARPELFDRLDDVHPGRDLAEDDVLATGDQFGLSIAREGQPPAGGAVISQDERRSPKGD